MILVHRILAQAAMLADQRASRPDVAAALVAALRRLRREVDGVSGYQGACAVDEVVRTALLGMSLGGGLSWTPPRTVPLPDAARAPGHEVAFALIDDALQSCLMLRDTVPGVSLDDVVRALVVLLAERLGGVPAFGELLDAIRDEEPRDERPGPKVVRLH